MSRFIFMEDKLTCRFAFAHGFEFYHGATLTKSVAQSRVQIRKPITIRCGIYWSLRAGL